MSSAIQSYIEIHSPLIDWALHSRLPASGLSGAESLNAAVSEAVFAGGKRMRPVLALLAAEVCGARADAGLPAACAVEFLHAASLALDDLPSMDDAVLRRGRPALHTMFGEDVALLAALALMNEAYGIFATIPGLLPRAVREIGVDGLIGGQAVDVRGSRSAGRMEKTTALMRLTMAAGAATAGAGTAAADLLSAFGGAVGEAYQMCDDIADWLGSDAELGKTAGQDRRNGRHSAVLERSPNEACRSAREFVENACAELRAQFGRSTATGLLEDFARAVVARGFDLVNKHAATPAAGVPRARRMERASLAGRSRG